MAKATIKKKVNPDGSGSFVVYKDDFPDRVLGFKPGPVDDPLWGIETNYNEAMKRAKEIEFGNPTEEIVYQTPETKEDLPPGVFEMPGI